MSQDRNKTGLTHDVTAAAARWLEERGFKPVETEVSVCLGWCADLAGVIVPTQTELIDLKLIPRRPSWKAPALDQQAWEQRYKLFDRTYTCMVEVKTSRGDFRGDRKWSLPCPTDLAYLAVPKGMVKLEECPARWGVLEYSDGAMRRLRAPDPYVTTTEEQLGVVLSIAVRRDHHTRYERWREYQKQDRVERAAEKTVSRVSAIARVMEKIVRGEGESVDRVFEYHGIKNMPEYAMERIRPLWGLAARTLIPPAALTDLPLELCLTDEDLESVGDVDG